MFLLLFTGVGLEEIYVTKKKKNVQPFFVTVLCTVFTWSN